MLDTHMIKGISSTSLVFLHQIFDTCEVFLFIKKENADEIGVMESEELMEAAGGDGVEFRE